MKRLIVAAAAVMLALPASAIAATASGTVLSVDAGHRSIQVTDGHHLVDAYHWRGRLPKLRPGSKISFSRVRRQHHLHRQRHRSVADVVADPSEEMFDGVSVGAGVVITYHQSAGQLIADLVDDETAGN